MAYESDRTNGYGTFTERILDGITPPSEGTGPFDSMTERYADRLCGFLEELPFALWRASNDDLNESRENLERKALGALERFILKQIEGALASR